MDDHTEMNGKLEHIEDQALIKQSLVSSYKKILYPAMKQEIQQHNRDTASSTAGTTRSK